ncbi:MAG: helix-turn-helix domain-containing protein [Candidatus Pacebacteria bacterium]|nr:helix-turn-helix domain-containing protein [Candidatus Paceibacterota bacterium]
MLDKASFYLNLGKKIKDERTKKGYSLDEFSKESGLNINKSTLSAIENGKQQISAFQLYLVAEALDLKITEVMKGIDTSNNVKLLNKDDTKNLDNI